MNEIKVGQWARYKLFISIFNDEGYVEKTINKVSIGKIEKLFTSPVKISGYYTNKDSIIKTSDNLEDLLEVGDIVHLEIKSNDGCVAKHEMVLNCFWLERIKNRSNIKITAIELHENRQIQEVGE